VRRAHEGGTKILFVTHDIGQARRLAGDVVFLNRGRLVEHSPARGFFTEPATPEARDYLAGRIVL
jgi:tungstate transport system ATP-binding protein